MIRGVQCDSLKEVRLIGAIRIPAQVVRKGVDPSVKSRVKFGDDAFLPLLLADLRDNLVFLERVLSHSLARFITEPKRLAYDSTQGMGMNELQLDPSEKIREVGRYALRLLEGLLRVGVQPILVITVQRKLDVERI